MSVLSKTLIPAGSPGSHCPLWRSEQDPARLGTTPTQRMRPDKFTAKMQEAFNGAIDIA